MTSPTTTDTPKPPSKLLRVLFIGLALFCIFFGGLLVLIASRPADYSIVRSTTIAASPQAVFDRVSDLRKWNDWSPWAKLDPNAKYSFSGPESGKGSAFSWSGNNEVGEGTMTITESTPPERVQFHMAFVRPMQDTSNTTFTFTPEGSGTKVVWTMSGKNNFVAKAMCLVMDMDKMVGGQFEQGLSNLKTLTESEATK